VMIGFVVVDALGALWTGIALWRDKKDGALADFPRTSI